MKHPFYEDEFYTISQVTSCPFPLEELPACWPTPELPPPLTLDAELVEAVRSSSGDLFGINEYRAFNGRWYLVHCEVIEKPGPLDKIVLFPPYAAKLAESEAFIKAAIANVPPK